MFVLRGITSKMTKKQDEILKLITIDNLTTKQIAQRRGVSVRSVEKMIQRLKQNGRLSKNVRNFDPPLTPKPNISYGIRLHAEEYNLKILSKTLKYDIIRNKGNLMYLDGNTIKLYTKSIEVYSNKSFFGNNVNEANRKSIKYWATFWLKLENLLGIVIIKDKKTNIRVVNQHYSDINNELAKECNIKKEKLRIKAKEDGKTAYEIDNSFRLNEFESKHPQTAKRDMEKAEKQFQDWRTNDPMTNTELTQIMQQNTQNINSLTEYNLIHAKNIESHIKAIQILGHQVKKLNTILKQLKK
jgi:hypothetical protein